MFGILLAVASNLVLVFADSGKKHLLTKYPTPVVIWSTMLMALLVIGGFALYQGLPTIDVGTFAAILPLAIGILTVSEILFITAIRTTDLSVAMPFRVFGPIFLVPVSFALGEEISLAAFVGVTVAMCGSYVLFGDSAPRELSLIAALKANRGVQCMLINAVIFCILVPLQRIGAEASSPVVFVWSFLLGEWLIFSAYLLINKKDLFIAFRHTPVLVSGIGAFWGVGFLLSFVCMNYTTALNVGLINQLHPLLSLPVGYLIFKERVTWRRVLGCVVMLVGVSTAILWQ
jgi:drug/metabolite transporter (DMT)-like permease